MKKTRCYIYTCVSTAIQVDGYSLDVQKDKLRKYAEFQDMEIVGEYSDEGHSGKNIKGRQEFMRMLNDIEDGKDGVDFVLVFKLSRFGRNAADVLSSLQLMQDYGVNLICVEDGIDSSKEAGKLLISIIAAVAEMERENIRVQTIMPIKKGWSSDRKNLITTDTDERLLLRVSDIGQFEAKKKEFDIIKKYAGLDIKMSEPIAFGICNDGSSVYMLLTWIEGQDLERILPKLLKEEQYRLGRQAGEILKKIHSIPVESTGFNLMFCEDIPYLIKCGVLGENDGKVIVNIPMLTPGEYKVMDKICIEYTHKLADIFEPLLREVFPKLKIKIPKHLEGRVAECRQYSCYAIPMAFIKKAIALGDFDDANATPPMVFIVDDEKQNIR